MTWLLAPLLNPLLKRGSNLISEYESTGMPYAAIFRFFDFLVAAVLILAIYQRKKAIKTRFSKSIVYILYAAGVLQIIDALTPIKCLVTSKICSPILNLSAYIHGAESFILSFIFFGLAVYIAKKQRRYLWLPLTMVACSVSGLILRNRAESLLYGIQLLSNILGLYTVWYLLVGDMFEKISSRQTKRKITKFVATFLALNAVASLAFATTHLARRIPLSDFVFTQDTAWLSQHTIISSLALLYLAKALWNGSNSAWRIVIFLVTLEFINYSAITADADRMITYLLLLITLIITKEAFDRRQSIARFKTRLKQAIGVVFITLLTSSLLAGAFRIHSTKQWDRSDFTPSRVIVRTLLLEIRTNKKDPLKARLLSQALTSVGIFMYAWLFLGLFLPSLLPNESLDPSDVVVIKELMHKYSRNSEDSLKLWPTDKSYWFTANRSSAVAYKQSGKYAFALADPIGPIRRIESTLSCFDEYCLQHGTFACWVMVEEKLLKYYERVGLKTLPIGSSAVVQVDSFANITVKTKWWRWVRNKAVKQGLSFQKLIPPHSAETITELRSLSDEWLNSNNHSERTFALGYFDSDFMSKSIIYILKEESGRIVAFTNQLPTYGEHKQATIDLMRFKPGIDGAMALLLSEIILRLHEENTYTTFDLGFVPLAGLGQSDRSATFAKFAKNVLKPLFSARGLEQFKNKFDPTWHKNYITFDGDYTDLPTLFIALQDVLQIKNDPTNL